MKKYLLVGTLMLAAAGFAPNASIAANGPQTKMPGLSGQSLVEAVQWRRCRWVRRECRLRWGWGWRYRRCVARRGCW